MLCTPYQNTKTNLTCTIIEIYDSALNGESNALNECLIVTEVRLV